MLFYFCSILFVIIYFLVVCTTAQRLFVVDVIVLDDLIITQYMLVYRRSFITPSLTMPTFVVFVRFLFPGSSKGPPWCEGYPRNNGSSCDSVRLCIHRMGSSRGGTF